ncbi:MAG: electron transport complex subunit E [Synergistaceae bacterium]|nr:electron transport complex subunit E [Synergistaceae bacterium]
MSRTNPLKILKNGVLSENPTFVQCIGLCPTLAVTTSVENGVGMGIAATFVLIASNAVISLLRKIVPDEVRIPIFIVVIAGFVTVIQFLMEGFAPELNKSLGIFIPLIVVNCIILARAEAFASKNGVIASALDGIGMGLGFTIALTFLGSIREILGAGTWLGHPVFSFEPALLVVLAPGGFIVLGCCMGAFRAIQAKLAARKGCPAPEPAAGCSACAMASSCPSAKAAGTSPEGKGGKA